MGMTKVYTVKEAAVFLKTTKQQVRKMIASGDLYAVKVGREWRILQVNTPPKTVPLDRTNGAAKPLKWCMVTAAMVH